MAIIASLSHDSDTKGDWTRHRVKDVNTKGNSGNTRSKKHISTAHSLHASDAPPGFDWGGGKRISVIVG